MKFLKFSIVLLSLLSFLTTGVTFYLSSVRENEKEKRIHLEQVRAKLETEIQGLQTEKADLEKKVTDLEAKQAELTKQLQSEQAARADANKTVKTKESELAKVRQDLDDTEKAFENAQKRSRELEKNLKQMEARYNAMEKELTALKNANAQAAAPLTDAVKSAVPEAQNLAAAIEGSMVRYIPRDAYDDATETSTPQEEKMEPKPVAKSEVVKPEVTKSETSLKIETKSEAKAKSDKKVETLKSANEKKSESKKTATETSKKKRGFFSWLKFWADDEEETLASVKKPEPTKKAEPAKTPTSLKVETKPETKPVAEKKSETLKPAIEKKAETPKPVVEKKIEVAKPVIEKKVEPVKSVAVASKAEKKKRGFFSWLKFWSDDDDEVVKPEAKKSLVKDVNVSSKTEKTKSQTPVAQPVKGKDGSKVAVSEKKPSEPAPKLQPAASEKKADDAKSAVPSTGDGSVLMVNRKFNFIVTNLGSRAGLALDNVLSVRRNDKEVGKVRIEKIYDDYCAAYITEEQSDAPIAEGDQVVSKK